MSLFYYYFLSDDESVIFGFCSGTNSISFFFGTCSHYTTKRGNIKINQKSLSLFIFFYRTGILEFTEFLGEFKRLLNDPFNFLIVSDFDKSGQREILP